MRRTVATLLVVASPLLTVVPVGASDARPAGPAPVPGTPAVVQLPAVPAPVTVAPPAAPAVVEAPAVAAAPALAAPAAPAVARPAVKAVRVKAPRAAAVTDAAYTARLQAELCRARQIFCGLDNGGRYPAR